MTEARTVARDLQEDILSAVRMSQTAVIEAIQTWTSKVQSLTPDLPDMSLPFTDKLPKPHELIASAYDFAEQMLASQRKFAEDALKAMAPLTAVQHETPATKTDVHNGTPAKKNGSAAR
jgi:hypothetical protein